MRIEDYPQPCRDCVNRIAGRLNIKYEEAYGMMVLTALLFDLHPHDKEVERMIMEGSMCGSE